MDEKGLKEGREGGSQTGVSTRGWQGAGRGSSVKRRRPRDSTTTTDRESRSTSDDQRKTP
eukprot:77547-Prorocentrum_minimum.AAC.1